MGIGFHGCAFRGKVDDLASLSRLRAISASVPGDPEGSPLLEFVQSQEPDHQMPPDGPGLDEREIAVLCEWIPAGATWPEGVDHVTSLNPRDHMERTIRRTRTKLRLHATAFWPDDSSNEGFDLFRFSTEPMRAPEN